jgi:hypothetical protein
VCDCVCVCARVCTRMFTAMLTCELPLKGTNSAECGDAYLQFQHSGGGGRQEDCEFETSLSYTARP